MIFMSRMKEYDKMLSVGGLGAVPLGEGVAKDRLRAEARGRLSPPY